MKSESLATGIVSCPFSALRLSGPEWVHPSLVSATVAPRCSVVVLELDDAVESHATRTPNISTAPMPHPVASGRPVIGRFGMAPSFSRAEQRYPTPDR